MSTIRSLSILQWQLEMRCTAWDPLTTSNVFIMDPELGWKVMKRTNSSVRCMACEVSLGIITHTPAELLFFRQYNQSNPNLFIFNCLSLLRSVRETHQIAEAQQVKNAKLREAFGISEYFVEGSSFDPDRKAKEDLKKSTALQDELQAQRENSKRYALVRTPSKERGVDDKEDRVVGDDKNSLNGGDNDGMKNVDVKRSKKKKKNRDE